MLETTTERDLSLFTTGPASTRTEKRETVPEARPEQVNDGKVVLSTLQSAAACMVQLETAPYAPLPGTKPKVGGKHEIWFTTRFEAVHLH